MSVDQAAEKVCRRAAGYLLVKFDKGEFGRAVDRHEQVEPALRRAGFRDVDMEIADRIDLEPPFCRCVALDFRQLRDAECRW
jgi:hypothetical protein